MLDRLVYICTCLSCKAILTQVSSDASQARYLYLHRISLLPRAYRLLDHCALSQKAKEVVVYGSSPSYSVVGTYLEYCLVGSIYPLHSAPILVLDISQEEHLSKKIAVPSDR